MLAGWQLSPCVLLEMREKFRQGHMQDLSHINSGDVEGYFGVLITLYYIHKLLSSHGIRPAHEMLERKLKQG
jgi:Fanconi anemia group M protein